MSNDEQTPQELEVTSQQRQERQQQENKVLAEGNENSRQEVANNKEKPEEASFPLVSHATATFQFDLSEPHNNTWREKTLNSRGSEEQKVQLQQEQIQQVQQLQQEQIQHEQIRQPQQSSGSEEQKVQQQRQDQNEQVQKQQHVAEQGFRFDVSQFSNDLTPNSSNNKDTPLLFVFDASLPQKTHENSTASQNGQLAMDNGSIFTFCSSAHLGVSDGNNKPPLSPTRSRYRPGLHHSPIRQGRSRSPPRQGSPRQGSPPLSPSPTRSRTPEHTQTSTSRSRSQSRTRSPPNQSPQCSQNGSKDNGSESPEPTLQAAVQQNEIQKQSVHPTGDSGSPRPSSKGSSRTIPLSPSVSPSLPRPELSRSDPTPLLKQEKPQQTQSQSEPQSPAQSPSQSPQTSSSQMTKRRVRARKTMVDLVVIFGDAKESLPVLPSLLEDNVNNVETCLAAAKKFHLDQKYPSESFSLLRRHDLPDKHYELSVKLPPVHSITQLPREVTWQIFKLLSFSDYRTLCCTSTEAKEILLNGVEELSLELFCGVPWLSRVVLPNLRSVVITCPPIQVEQDNKKGKLYPSFPAWPRSSLTSLSLHNFHGHLAQSFFTDNLKETEPSYFWATCPNLESLSLRESSAFPAGYEVLSRLTTLVVETWGTGIIEDRLTWAHAFPAFTSLKKLHVLRDSLNKNVPLGILEPLSQLEDLDISGLGDRNFSIIGRLTRLQRLRLACLGKGYEIDAHDLVTLTKLHTLVIDDNLKLVNLGSSGLLQNLPYIKILKISGNMKDPDLFGLEKCSTLTRLSIRSQAISEETALHQLLLLTRLTHLSFRLSGAMNLSTWAKLLALPMLNKLTIRSLEMLPEEIRDHPLVTMKIVCRDD